MTTIDEAPALIESERETAAHALIPGIRAASAGPGNTDAPVQVVSRHRGGSPGSHSSPGRHHGP